MRTKIRLQLKTPAIILIIFTLLLLAVQSAYAGEAYQKEIVTGMDENGNLIKTEAYGYDVYSENFGQAFILCNPDTGEETGEAYIPGDKIGTKMEEKDKGYKEKIVPDWENPIEIKPVEVTVKALNVPTDIGWDYEKYSQDEVLERKLDNEFIWSKDSSYTWTHLIPDEAGWLIVAIIANPNNVPVKAEGYVRIDRWVNEWGFKFDALIKDIDTEIGANGEKYFLLNEGENNNWNLYRENYEWDGGKFYPGYSLAKYSFDVDTLDPDYPDVLLKNNGDKGYYREWVKWDGINYTIHSLIPIKPAYEIYCDGVFLTPGDRESDFEKVHAYIEYNTENEEWKIASINMNDGWWYKLDRELDRVENGNKVFANSKAIEELKEDAEERANERENQIKNAKANILKMFKNWGLANIPHYIYKDDYLEVDTDTVTVRIDRLIPVPPRNAEPFENSYRDRWGGWLCSASSPGISAWEYPAPAMINSANYSIEKNYVRRCGKTLPAGAYEATRKTDPQYYGQYPDNYNYKTLWMEEFPIVKAEPMFIERWEFIKTDGDEGYLNKKIVPGYRVYVEDDDPRPKMKRNSGILGIEASYECGDGCKGSYAWTPGNGWIEESVSGTCHVDTDWEWTVKVKYEETVTAENGLDTTVKWTNPNGITFHNQYINDLTIQADIEEYKNGNENIYKSAENKNCIESALLKLAKWDIKEGKRSRGGPSYIKQVRLSGTIETNFDGIYKTNLKELSLEAGETRQIYSIAREPVIIFDAPHYKYQDIDYYLGKIAELAIEFNSKMENDTEAVFNEGTEFQMESSFEEGKGGIIGGAKRYLLHGRYERKDYGVYGWEKDKYEIAIIGFPWAHESTLMSYLQESSPTEGLIVSPDSSILARLLQVKDDSGRMPLRGEAFIGRNLYSSCCLNYWRHYWSGDPNKTIYPKDLPGN